MTWKGIQSVIFIVLLLRSVCAFAIELDDVAPQQIPADFRSTLIKWVDTTHFHISKGILTTSDRFDSLFGDEQAVKTPQNSSYLMFVTSFEMIEGESSELAFPIRVHLEFPHLKDRFHFFLDTMLKEEKHAETVKQKAPDEQLHDEESKNNREITLGFRYKLWQQTRKWLIMGAVVKLRADSNQPFGKMWLRRVFDLNRWSLQLTQYALWFREKAWGERSRVELQVQLPYHVFFNTSSHATWTKDSEGLDWAQSVRLRYERSHDWGAEVEFNGFGHTKPATVADQYTAKLSISRRLYNKWLFLDIEPEAQFLRENHFVMTPMLTLYLKMKFGGGL